MDGGLHHCKWIVHTAACKAMRYYYGNRQCKNTLAYFVVAQCNSHMTL